MEDRCRGRAFSIFRSEEFRGSPAHARHRSQTDWGYLIDMISRPHMANALLDKLLKYKIKMVGHFMGLGVDVIRLGDDVGWQKGMLISPDLWRRYLKPRMRVLIAHIRKHSEAYMSWLLIFSGSP
ncbi:MAG: hypothetical protein J7L11_02725 [Thermoprotei archaeon]|nr:hypothetical protein [Thermoprotei archaeon]